MPKQCQKCNKQFSIRQLIDNKIRIVSKRKLCLECSPFGSKNTRPNGLLSSDEKREQSKLKIKRKSAAVSEWRRRTKSKLIEYKGGKCQICGYDKKCSAAYDFHHRNPKLKLFGISEGTVKSFDKMKAEADKCDLLCKNCHAEIHSEECNTDKNPNKVLKIIQKRPKIECFFCKTKFYGSKNRIFCSQKCRINHVQTVQAPENIFALYKELSISELANKFKVSIHVIKNWLNIKSKNV